MTTTPSSFDLSSRDRFGLRFTAPEAEQAYRAWRNEQVLPMIRLVGAVGIPCNLSAALPGYLWWPGFNWFDVFLWNYVLSVPLSMLAIVIAYSRVRRFATVFAALTLAVNGSVLVWNMFVGAARVVGVDTTGPAMAFAILSSCFALFNRLPPLLAAATIAPFMLPAIMVSAYRAQTNAIPAIQAYPYVFAASLACFIVVVMSIVGERFLRGAFVMEQLLARQKLDLERSRNLIRRYVPPALAQHIIDGKLDALEAPHRRRVTILFSDVAGFTAMADRVEPEVMSQVIGEHMAAMADIVDAHRGTVNEFVGDGLMALFGAPQALEPDEQARCAVRAAQAMQAKLPELNARWRKLGLGASLRVRIGINTGMVSVGSYGSEGRMTYTAIGLQTNIAARIQAHCQPGDILLSDATWQLIQDEIACEARGSVECKGVHFPIATYAPIPSSQPAGGRAT